MSLENLTTLDKLLKDVYAPVVREQMSLYSAAQEIFEKIEDAEFDGRQVKECAIMSFNEGVGAIGESGNLPTAGNFDPQNFTIPMKYMYGTIKMTKPMIESAKTSKGAFKNAMRTSMESMVRNLKRERARMLWGWGSGALARVNDATPDGAAAVGIDCPGGVTGSFGGTRFLRSGMIVSMGDIAAGLVRSIVSVDSSTQITLSSATSGGTDNNLIYRVATAASTAAADYGKDNEPMGILGLIDDGTYVATLHGLSRSSYPVLKSRVEASIGALSLDAIQRNFDIAEQMGDAQIDNLMGHHSVRRAYLALLEADRRYTGGDLSSPDGGTKVVKRGQYVTFGGKPIIEDRNAPYDMLFGVDKRDMKRYVQVEGEWADDDGTVLHRVTGKDEYEAFYRIWENYHCSRPNTCFRMEGITTGKIYVASY